MKQAAFLDQISIIIHGSKTAPNCLRIPAGFTCFLVPSLPQALYSEAKLGIVNLPPTSHLSMAPYFFDTDSDSALADHDENGFLAALF